MKKVLLGSVVLFMSLSLMGCNTNKTEEENSVSSSSLVEDTADEETEEMEQMEEDLSEKGVEVRYYNNYMYFTREKSIDYDYFKLTFIFGPQKDEFFKIWLGLKGNIDGKEKEDLVYNISQGRIVESEGDNTDIKALAEVLESLGYSDKELLEFANWFYHNK